MIQQIVMLYFKNFKNIIYLLLINNPKYRKSYTKFRLSDHKLMIEEARRKRPTLPRGEEFAVCKVIENEKHFLMECHIFDEKRLANFQKITDEIPGFSNIANNNEKFIFLMTHKRIKLLLTLRHTV